MIETVTEWLRQSESIISVWRFVILAFVFYLLGLGVLIFTQRNTALRFLSGYGSNVALNTLEAVLRAVVGLAIMGTAPDNRFPTVAFYAGLVFVVTSFGIFAVPRLHNRYGKWSMRVITPVLSVYGAASILLGVAVLYSVHWGAFSDFR